MPGLITTSVTAAVSPGSTAIGRSIPAPSILTSYNASDFLIVHAHVDGDPDKPTLFLVDLPADGLTHVRSPKFMHHYTFDHAELKLDGVGVR